MQKRYTRIPRPFARLGTKGVVEFYQLVSNSLYAISIEATVDDLRYNTVCEYVIKESDGLAPRQTRLGYYNRSNLHSIINLINLDKSKVLEEVVHHPIDKERMVKILNHHYACDMSVDDFDLTHIAGNEYLLTALPDSIGYYGEGIIQIGQRDKNDDELVPIHHAYIMSNDKDIIAGNNITVNGVKHDVNSENFFKETGLIYHAFGVGNFKSVVLINTKDTPMKVVLPNNMFVAAPTNVNQSVKSRDETIILTALKDITHRLPSEPLVVNAEFSADTWLKNLVEFDGLFIIKVNDELVTFEDLVVGRHGVKAIAEDGKLKLTNTNYFPVKVNLQAKTDSIQATGLLSNRFLAFQDNPDLTSWYEYYYLTLSARERIKPTINLTHYLPETEAEYLALLAKVDERVGNDPVVTVDENGLLTSITALNLEHSTFEQYKSNITVAGDTKNITLKLQEDGLKYLDLYLIDKDAWLKIKQLDPNDHIFTIRSTDLNGKDERGETYTVNHLLRMTHEVENGAVFIFTRTINQSAINTFVFSSLVLNGEREVSFKSIVKGGNRYKPQVTIDVGEVGEDNVINLTPTIDEVRTNSKEVTATLTFNLPKQFLAIQEYLSRTVDNFDDATMFEATVKFGKAVKNMRFNFHDYRRMVTDDTPIILSISDTIDTVNRASPKDAKLSSKELSISVTCDGDGEFAKLMDIHQDVVTHNYHFNVSPIHFPLFSVPTDYDGVPSEVLITDSFSKEGGVNHKDTAYYRVDEERPYIIIPPGDDKTTITFEYSVNPELEELYKTGAYSFRFHVPSLNVDINDYNQFISALKESGGKKYISLNVPANDSRDGTTVDIHLTKQITEIGEPITDNISFKVFKGRKYPSPTSELYTGEYLPAMSVYRKHAGLEFEDTRFFKINKQNGVIPAQQRTDDNAFIATVRYRRDTEDPIRVNVPISVNIPTLADVEKFKENDETVLTINGETYTGREITSSLFQKDDKLMLIGGINVKGETIIDKKLEMIWSFPYTWTKEAPMTYGFSNTTDNVVVTVNQVIETLEMPSLVLMDASETYSKQTDTLPIKVRNKVVENIPFNIHMVEEGGVTVRKPSNVNTLTYLVFTLDTTDSKAVEDIKQAMSGVGEHKAKVELNINGEDKVINQEDIILSEEGWELYIPIELPSESKDVNVTGNITVYPDTKPNSYFIPKATEFSRSFKVYKAYPSVHCLDSSNVSEEMNLDKEYRLVIDNVELMTGDINAISSYMNTHYGVTYAQRDDIATIGDPVPSDGDGSSTTDDGTDPDGATESQPATEAGDGAGEVREDEGDDESGVETNPVLGEHEPQPSTEDTTTEERQVEQPGSTSGDPAEDPAGTEPQSEPTGGTSSTDTEAEERPGDRGTDEATGDTRGDGEGTSGEDSETGDGRDGVTIAEIPPKNGTEGEEGVSGETRPETTSDAGNSDSTTQHNDGERESTEESGRGIHGRENDESTSSGTERGTNDETDPTSGSEGVDDESSGIQTVDTIESPPQPPAKRYIGTALVIKNNRVDDKRVGAFIDNQVDLSASGLSEFKAEDSSVDVTTWRNHTDEPIVLRNIAGTWSSDNSTFIVSDFTSLANGSHHNHHETSDAEEFIILPTVGGIAYTEHAYNVGLRAETAIYPDEDNRLNLAEADNVEKIVLTTSDGEAVRFLANAVNVGETHTTDFFSHRELTRTEDGSFTPSEGDGDYNWYRYRADSNSLTINYTGTTNRIYTLSYGSKLEATNSVEVKYRVGEEMKSVFVSRFNPSFKIAMH